MKEDVEQRYEEAKKEEERKSSFKVILGAFFFSLFLWLLGKIFTFLL